MEERKGRDVAGVREIGVKLRQQPGVAHRLINDGRRRERADIALGSAALELLAGQIEPAIAVLKRDGAESTVDRENLTDHRQSGGRDFAQNLRPRRHFAPAQDGESPRRNGLFQIADRCGSGGRLRRQKDHAHSQRLGGIESDAGGGKQNLARNCGVNADPVARLAVSSHRAAMRQTRKRSQCLLQNVMRGLVVEGSDKSDATGFMIETLVDQTFGPGVAGRQGRSDTIPRSHIQL